MRAEVVASMINQGRREYGNEIPWSCSGRSSGELSGPFCLENPHFHVRCPQIVQNCSRERSLEHCHSHFLSLNLLEGAGIFRICNAFFT